MLVVTLVGLATMGILTEVRNERNGDATEGRMADALGRAEVAFDAWTEERVRAFVALHEQQEGDVRATPVSVLPEVQSQPIPEPSEEPLNEPVPPPSPQPIPEPELEPPAEPAEGAEAVICGYPWECSIALRVAACESGSDYTAGYNASGHAGTFQLSPIHAWRFSARGLDFWTDAVVLQWNLEVAYEIWTERWWYAWSCF